MYLLPLFSPVVVVRRAVMTSAGPDDDTLLIPRGGGEPNAVTQAEGTDLTPISGGTLLGGGRRYARSGPGSPAGGTGGG